ncbi:hypothetical protein BGZ61DRAFT_457584 [Ilyonectria robusta]|uniref:uncharacterized protein n=1 Tax=Ilyonectria robusta TaxID=1079257 RepID=UPI001E8E80C3|nr:uncharacterized protein BGZ61DRAFT_457584 [Ilyonectria robusta]KAH8677087.1 hypothetical protein BGZ61DRAFT_457584 [Ilyonectria robusta]
MSLVCLATTWLTPFARSRSSLHPGCVSFDRRHAMRRLSSLSLAQTQHHTALCSKSQDRCAHIYGELNMVHTVRRGGPLELCG